MPKIPRLNKFLRSARIKKGISQMKVAQRCGYSSPQFISNFERGECALPLKRLGKIRTLLNIPRPIMKNILLADYNDRVNRALK